MLRARFNARAGRVTVLDMATLQEIRAEAGVLMAETSLTQVRAAWGRIICHVECGVGQCDGQKRPSSTLLARPRLRNRVMIRQQAQLALDTTRGRQHLRIAHAYNLGTWIQEADRPDRQRRARGAAAGKAAKPLDLCGMPSIAIGTPTRR